MASRGNIELEKVPVSMSGIELGETVSTIGPRAHKGAKGEGFRGNMGENVKGMSRNGIGKVRDDSNTVPSIRSLVRRCVSRWSSVRKSRGRVRT